MACNTAVLYAQLLSGPVGARRAMQQLGRRPIDLIDDHAQALCRLNHVRR